MSYKPVEAILQSIRDNQISEVSLSHRGLDDGACQAISEVLRHSTSVTVLDLQGNTLTAGGVAILCGALRVNKSVHELGLSSNDIDDVGARLLLDLLYSNTSLKAIALAGNPISTEMLQEIDFRASLNMQPQQFKELAPKLLAGETVEEVDISGVEGTLSVPILVKVLSANNTVKVLRLNDNHIGDMGADIIGALLAENTTMEELELGGNGISIHGVRNLTARGLNTNTSLRRLSLARNKVGDDAARELIKVLRVNDCLLELDVSENAVTQTVAESLAYSLHLNAQPIELKRARQAIEMNDPNTTDLHFPWIPNMTLSAYFLAPVLKTAQHVVSLNISNARVGDSGALEMAGVLKQNRSLRIVEMANNSITSDGACELASALELNNALTELNLANNEIGNEGTAAFAAALQLNDTLAVMNVELNPCSDELFDELEGLLLVNQQPIQLKRMLNALEANEPELTVVDFSQFDGERFFNDASALVLARGLADNTAVKEVDLSNNNVSDTGAVHLANFLRNNRGITSLVLDGNCVGDRGGEALADALRENNTLLSLSLKGNTCGEATAHNMLSMLQVNHTLNTLIMDGCRVSKSMLNEIRIAATVNLQPQSLKFLLPQLRSQDAELKEVLVPGPIESNADPSIRIYDDTAVTILCHEMAGNENIQVLDLSDNKITAAGCVALAEWLASPTTKIQELRLYGNSIGNEGAKTLSESFKTMTTLEKLDLRQTGTTDEGIAAIAEALQMNFTIKSVLVTKEDCSPAAAAILSRELSINHQPISLKEILPAIVRNDPGVNMVDLPATQERVLDDVSCQLLSHALAKNSNVAYLNLRGNNITSRGVEFLADLLEDHKALVEVHLDDCQIDNHGAELLIKALNANYMLRYLGLAGNPISLEPSREIEYLLRVNNAPKSLKQALIPLASDDARLKLLNFDGQTANMRFGDDAVRILCALLVNNSYVTHISLVNNSVTDIGASYLADLLRVNNVITHIDLFGNEVTEEGAIFLFQALKANPTCVSLGLGNNKIPPKAEVFEDMQGALTVNAVPLKFPKKKRGEFMYRTPIEDLTSEIMFKDTEYYFDVGDQVWNDGMVNCPPRFAARFGVFPLPRQENGNQTQQSIEGQ